MQLSFLGGAGTVTGSKFLLTHEERTLLVDCGLFQGFSALRERNWAAFPIPPNTIDAVMLTHAHLDHSGYLPLLHRRGFEGPIFCSQATMALAGILLPDAGYLQEKDAEFANRHGYSKHKPALPLFTADDATRVLQQFRPLAFGKDIRLPQGAMVHLRRAGHIIGAGSVVVTWGGRTIAFSGDLGRYNDPILPDPQPIERADYLLVESTYGNRTHPAVDPAEVLGAAVDRAVTRGGTVIIPAFAVGRAQSLLFHLHRLKARGRLSNIPIFLDSPMAVNASDIFCRESADHKLTADECRSTCAVAHYVGSVEESKALTANPLPKVIISASGMATGGRVLHHIKRYAPDHRNMILFAGYQADGTRGAAMVAGADSVRIHGAEVSVRAEVSNLDMLSAHADSNEIMRWLRGFRSPPRMTFIVHGEPAAADALRVRIEEELRWPCVVAEHGQTTNLR